MQNYEDLFGIVEPLDTVYNYPLGEEPTGNFSGYGNSPDVDVDKMATATFIGLALDAIGIGANLWMNYSNNRRNDERAEEAYQQSVAMWNKQTDYNSPANQIARLKQAGLNPNLLYGSPQNTASSAPEKKASQGSPGRVDPLQAMNALMLGKQIQSIDSQIKVQDAEARNIDASTAGIELDNEKKTFDNSKQGERYSREVRSFEQNYQYVYNEMLLIAQQVVTERKKGQLFDSQKTAQDLENAFNKAVESERIQQFITQGKISKQQLANLQKEWQKLCVEIDNLGKQGKILDQQRLFDELNNIVFASQNWGSLKNSPITYYTDKETGELKIVARGMTNLDINEGAYVILEFLKEAISAFNGGGLKYTNISGNSKTTTIDNSTNNRNY